mgnify:CR=1 FL=1
MSVAAVILLFMDGILFLIIGLAVGVTIGWLIGRQRNQGAGDQSISIQLAAAEARNEALAEQLRRSDEDRLAREHREREENKFLVALEPVRDRLESMQKSVTEIERERTVQFNTIQEQLRTAREAESQLRESTKVLANAMSNNQNRGQWGELQLRKVVEITGMLPHVDFLTQVSTTNDEGQAIKPDLVINMPDGKFVAVDAKAPFSNYQRATAIPEIASDQDNRQRIDFMKAHATDVKKRIDEISAKNYFSGLPSSPEFTIMFLPSESVLAATLEYDINLLEYAFNQRVALVSPVSFFSVLKTIAYGWRQSAQEETIKEVISLGARLYKNIRVVAEHAVRLSKSLDDSVKNYNKFAVSLEQNLLTSTRQLDKKSKGLLSDGKEIPLANEISEATQIFTKPELTELEVAFEELEITFEADADTPAESSKDEGPST